MAQKRFWVKRKEEGGDLPVDLPSHTRHNLTRNLRVNEAIFV